jgi:hypothetical protein
MTRILKIFMAHLIFLLLWSFQSCKLQFKFFHYFPFPTIKFHLKSMARINYLVLLLFLPGKQEGINY